MFLGAVLLLFSLVTATILQNGQIRPTGYPDTTLRNIAMNDSGWNTYPANASELSYKGRWDQQYISWWSAPGLKFGFQASSVAITFGNHTSDGVLVAYRIDGEDWQLTNLTSSSTNLFVSPQASNSTSPSFRNSTHSFEEPFSESLCTFDLSVDGAVADGIVSDRRRS